MLIVCPRCDSSFELSSDLLQPDGRRLECSDCHHSWYCGSDGLPREGMGMTNETEERDDASSLADKLGGVSSDDGLSDVEGVGSGGGDGILRSDVDSLGLEASSDMDNSEDSSVSDIDDLLSSDGGERDQSVSEEGEDVGVDGVSVGSVGDGGEDYSIEGSSDGVSDIEEEIDEEDSLREHERRIRQRKRGFRGRSRRGEGVFGWLFLIFFIGGMGWGGYRYMDEVISYYPPAASVYSQLGLLRPLGEGLRILPARTETLENEDGQKTLLVVGEIFNTRSGSQDVLEVPLLRGALIDSNEREVRVWTFRADEDRILPNERIIYRTEIGDPPTNVRALKITFARVSEGLN